MQTRTQAEHRLYMLQADWYQAIRVLETISTDIARHPEWGIEIGPHGPQTQTSIQQPHKSALNRLQELSNTYSQN